MKTYTLRQAADVLGISVTHLRVALDEADADVIEVHPKLFVLTGETVKYLAGWLADGKHDSLVILKAHIANLRRIERGRT